MNSIYDNELKHYIRNNGALPNKIINQLCHDYPLNIPTKVYRGLHFDTKQEYENFLQSISGGTISTNEMTSWTTDNKVALGFAKSKKSYDPTLALIQAETQKTNSGDHMAGYGGVVISTTARIGVNIGLSTFGVESEIILPAETYKIENIDSVMSFRHSINTKAKLFEFVDTYIECDNKKERLEYLLKNIEKLTPQYVDKVFNIFYEKQIKAYGSNTLESLVIVREEHSALSSEVTDSIVVHVNFAISKEWIELCTPKTKEMFIKIIKSISNILGKKLKLLQINNTLTTVKISSSIKELNKIYPNFDIGFGPLKLHFAKLYNEMNYRGVKYDQNYVDKLKKVMAAISALSV